MSKTHDALRQMLKLADDRDIQLVTETGAVWVDDEGTPVYVADVLRSLVDTDDTASTLLAALKDAVESLKRLPDTDGAWRVSCIAQGRAAIIRAEKGAS